MHSALSLIKNNYSYIEQQYAKITGDELCSDPKLSVDKYPLSECKYMISIVIPTWNSSNSLRYTLNSLSYCGVIRKFSDKVEILLIDDGSDDNLIDLLSSIKFPYRIRFIKQRHMGRAQAINMATFHATGDIIIFCDADLVVTPYAIDELVKRQQLFLHDAIFFGFRQDVYLESLRNGLEHFLEEQTVNLEQDNRFLTDFPGGWGTNMMLETDRLQGYSCEKNIYVTNNKVGIYDIWQLYRMPYGFLLSVSRQNLLSVGGFAEYLVGWGFDDTEFSAKCLLKGIKLIPVPSAFVYHIYHPIRSNTQWEEGIRNERRMVNRLKSLRFKNYISNSLLKRIILQKEFHPSTSFPPMQSSWYSFRCCQSGYQYHYLLGNMSVALDLLLDQDINQFSKDMIDTALDLSIRLNRVDVYECLSKMNLNNNVGFYWCLSCWYFEDRIISTRMDDSYYYFAKNLGERELCKRALKYEQEQQWYLALRDYMGAYIASDGKSKEIYKKCELIKEQLLSSN